MIEFPAHAVMVDSATGRIGLGLGEEGQPPAAVIWLCPCHGALEIAGELQAAAIAAAEEHPQHGAWPNRATRRAMQRRRRGGHG